MLAEVLEREKEVGFDGAHGTPHRLGDLLVRELFIDAQQECHPLAIGKAGATNAALLAVSILANKHDGYAAKLEAFRKTQTQRVLEDSLS